MITALVGREYTNVSCTPDIKVSFKGYQRGSTEGLAIETACSQRNKSLPIVILGRGWAWGCGQTMQPTTCF